MRPKKSSLFYTGLLIVSMYLLAAGAPALYGQDWSGLEWWPVKTKNWYLPEGQMYNPEGKVVGRPAPMLVGPKDEEFVVAEKAKKPWKIGVLIPHLKDPYWLTANWAFADEAKRLGVRLWFKSAGGYTEVNTQLQQLEALHTMGMDGMVLASVHSSAPCKLIKEIAQKGAKIVTAGIDSQCQDIQSNIIAPYIANGRRVAEWLDKQTREQKDVKVAWFPGPSGPSWPIDSHSARPY
jgi:protein TorT